MKKSMRKPENWQDFESLCKKLFGEIWECSLTIKKNGRTGQVQSGIDIYGRPRGREKYWGIQCKGKDDCTKAQLTEKEVDEEINKARTFKPEIETFIFATTANKDVAIEEYIRLKDQESRNSGGFEIVLFSWEDLVDLIEENRETFTWYTTEQQYREKFGFDVVFEGRALEKVINPVYTRTTKRYKLIKLPTRKDELMRFNLNQSIQNQLFKGTNKDFIYSSLLGPSHRNFCWCSVKLIMRNTGSKVLDDWKVYFNFENDKCKSIDDDSPKGVHLLNIDPKYILTYTHKKDSYISYRPLENRGLLQTESLATTVYVLPKPDVQSIDIHWELVARDYQTEGHLTLVVEPIFEDKLVVEEVIDEILLLPDEVSVEEKRELINSSRL